VISELLLLSLFVSANNEELPPGEEPAPGGEVTVEPRKDLSIETEIPQASDSVLGEVPIGHPTFSEDKTLDGDGWDFGFHGYVRMPVRFHGSPKDARPPYLVDDHYYNSGFGYLRINETEFAELFLNVGYKETRLVIGLMASQFTDWSETTLSGQNGFATAFVEHDRFLGEHVQLGIRAGMFWDRNGYLPDYDTYLLGRAHVAGLRLRTKIFDLVYAKAGFGAHADVISANQGFTPVLWGSLGVDLKWLDLSGFYGMSWTGDKREFSIVENGVLRVFGGEGRVAIPYFGPAHLVVSFNQARSVLFLANSYEILHSTGGRGLTQNFFGDVDDGTGEALVFGGDLEWQPARLLEPFAGADVARALSGFSVRFFGMLAWVASNTFSEDPVENFHDRVWFKWGLEPSWRPHWSGFDWIWIGLRYDRVILDQNHESLAFRVLTPRLGVHPLKDINLDVFLSYSKYWYGENVQLRPNQIAGDRSVTTPDDSVFKIQAQVSW
jgi:hypothetical protein